MLLKIHAVFGIDVQCFSENDEARLIADLREAVLETPEGNTVSLAEIKELAADMPAVARLLLALQRRLHEERESASALAARLGDDRSGLVALRVMPYEEVRDFFYTLHNGSIWISDSSDGYATTSCRRGLSKPLPRIRTLCTN